MARSVRRILIALALLIFIILVPRFNHHVHSQQGTAFSGYCNLGASHSLTSGLPSSNFQQGIIPSCTVTVYLTGTTNKATIYKDANNTPLGNPFTANTDGTWLFFAATNQGYDVTLSGGFSPNAYQSPVTITDLLSSQAVVNVLCDGSTDATAVIQNAITASAGGTVILPAGTCKVSSFSSLTGPIRILGSGMGQTTLLASSASPVAAVFDIENASNVELGNFTLNCASSPATCTVAVKVRFSKNIVLHDMGISGGGYAALSNPRANIYCEDVDNFTLDKVKLANAGYTGGYDLVCGYNGLPSTRIHIHNVTEDNGVAAISFALFNAQWSTIDGGTYCNENNQTDSLTSDGYCYMIYATNTSYSLSSGCTGSGTLTCTIPLSSGNTQLPVGASFQVIISGVTGGTGTLNGTFDATLASPTTFTISGGNTSGASYGSAIAFFPSTNNIIANTHAKNCAGTCYYLQASQYTTITGWDAENSTIQEGSTSLPAGCIAINAGYAVAPIALGDAIGPGTCNGSGQNGIDFANTSDLSVGGGITLKNIAGVAIRDFSANQNANFSIGNITVDGAAKAFSTTGTGTPHNGKVGPLVASNFTTAGLFPNLGNIQFHNIQLYAPSGLPGVNDFVTGNKYTDVWVDTGNWTIAGTGTKIVGGGVTNSTATHSVTFLGAQHISMKDFTIDSATQGMFFINSGATQNTDIGIVSSHLINLSSQPAFWDQAPGALTITTHTSTSVDIAATGATVAAGFGIGDYGTGGNNDIPQGTTITGGPYTCSGGCTVTISQAATGSHASEAGLLQATMNSNIRIWDTDASASSVNVQGMLFYGMQGLDLQRYTTSGFTTVAPIDFRGMTGQVTPVTLNTINVTGSSNVALLNLPGGILGSAAHVSLINPVFSGTATNSIVDTGTGAGNVFDFRTGSLGGNVLSITNTADIVKGQFTPSLTPAAATVSTCTVQTFNPAGLFWASGQQLFVTPPADMGTHLWLGTVRASAANTVAISFCADAAGGTPPAGTWKLIAQ